jgi:hypothetical protein
VQSDRTTRHRTGALVDTPQREREAGGLDVAAVVQDVGSGLQLLAVDDDFGFLVRRDLRDVRERRVAVDVERQAGEDELDGLREVVRDSKPDLGSGLGDDQAPGLEARPRVALDPMQIALPEPLGGDRLALVLRGNVRTFSSHQDAVRLVPIPLVVERRDFGIEREADPVRVLISFGRGVRCQGR